MGVQRHEKVVNEIVMKIFSRELEAGVKLPPERELSKQMCVDRTSLRVALKQLEAMHLLDIRQGDGIYVKDYVNNAGLDFLELIFLMDLDGDKKSIVDAYLVDELWEFWIEFLPTMLRVASKKFAPRDVKNLNTLLDEELEQIDNKESIVELELKSQEMVAKATNNILFILITNSSRQLRKKMLEMFVDNIGLEKFKEHVELKKSMLASHFAGSVEDVLKAAGKYRETLKDLRKKIRKASI